MSSRQDDDSPLEKEIDFFMKRLPFWLLTGKRGRWVSVNDNVSVFGRNVKEAVERGYDSFGNVPFLVREVSLEYIRHGRYGKPVNLNTVY